MNTSPSKFKEEEKKSSPLKTGSGNTPSMINLQFVESSRKRKRSADREQMSKQSKKRKLNEGGQSASAIGDEDLDKKMKTQVIKVSEQDVCNNYIFI